MADIDFNTSLINGMEIEFPENPRKVSGNRLLLNIFEITFMTERRKYLREDGYLIVDNYGGGSMSRLGVPRVLSDSQAMAATINIITSQVVKDMRADEKESTPATERIDKAEVISLDTIGGIITATIRVYPVETEAYEDLIFNLPIIEE